MGVRSRGGQRKAEEGQRRTARGRRGYVMNDRREEGDEGGFLLVHISNILRSRPLLPTTIQKSGSSVARRRD